MSDGRDKVALLAAREIVELELALAESKSTVADIHQESEEHRIRVNIHRALIDGVDLCRSCATFPVKQPDATWSYLVCATCSALNEHASTRLEMPSLAPFKLSQSGDDEMAEWLSCFSPGDGLLADVMAWHECPESLDEWRSAVSRHLAASQGMLHWPDIPRALWQRRAMKYSDYCARWFLECLFHFIPEFVLEFPFLLDASFHMQAMTMPTEGAAHA
jgi:hypothetical protein